MQYRLLGRTGVQVSYLPATELTLSADVLDRIDQIVAPGVTINPDDNSYGTHELTAAARRR